MTALEVLWVMLRPSVKLVPEWINPGPPCGGTALLLAVEACLLFDGRWRLVLGPAILLQGEQALE